VIGCGYVGLVTGTCFAELGNLVTCIDSDLAKIESLAEGTVPFYEPGLSELVLRNQHSGRLRFVTSIADGIRSAECIFIAVGTPMGTDGEADLSHVRTAAREIAESLDHDALVVNKSTVPTETGDLVLSIIRAHSKNEIDVSVVSNPEFLREGSAVNDFMQPDRIVLGVSDEHALEKMKKLYAPLNAAIFATDIRTAEMIKYTANAFLAMKISFINEIANICERVGADVKDVVAGAGSDRRIGTAFMQAGLGFGGSCFPKDVNALARIAAKAGAASVILPAVLKVNRERIDRVVETLEAALGGLTGKHVGILGLAFKPNTDDIRESPAVALAARIAALGAVVVAHDPEAMSNARGVLDCVRFVDDYYQATNNAHAVVVATEWNEYKQLDFGIVRKLMAGRIIMDARNIYEPESVESNGLEYIGIGRRRTAGAPRDGSAAATEAVVENA